MLDNEWKVLWPDGTWCYVEELDDYLTMMSDDYIIVTFEDDEYDKLV